MILDLQNASHIIIGESKDTAGLIDIGLNEFEAYKIALKYKKQGYFNIKVVQNNSDGLQQASDLMQNYIKKKWP